MSKQRKDTPKRRRTLKATDVAVIITALGALLTGIAAVLSALK